MQILDRIGLVEYAHQLPASLSSGQQQSAAIARALATDPAILLADEPTGNLDSHSAEGILILFEELVSQGKTILVVTHDPSITARTDQTVILSDGELIDQTVARALPFLNHSQLLTASHSAQKSQYPPGSMIIHQGKPATQFFMVTSGEVEVFVNTRVPDTTVARLGQGQFFGEISLISSSESIAGVRAANNSMAEITMLPKDVFLDLLKGSPKMATAMEKIARVRMEETTEVLRQIQSK
jgi:energy-coupling factor transporter ATP-binding protein EcfA2